MKRYIETFFRYWYIALLPVVALPAAAYAIIGHPIPSYYVYTNVYVTQSPADNNSPYNSAADNEAQDFNSSIKLPGFDQAVVADISGYQQSIPHGTTAATDLNKNISITSQGPHLMSVGYTASNYSIGLMVVHSFVEQQQVADQQNLTHQAAFAVESAQRQYRIAQKALTQATRQFKSYVAQRGYNPDDVTSILANNEDPQLAAYNNGVQNAIANEKQAGNAVQQAMNTQKDAAGTPVRLSNYYIAPGGDGYSYNSGRKKAYTNVLIALVVGLILGVAFVVVKSLLNRSLLLVEEVSALLGLPVLTTLPYSHSLAAQHIGTMRPVGAQTPPRGLIEAGRMG